MERPLLSLVVITLNEADRLARCLRSVPFAQEVLVVDSGSTDGTQGVARALGARVVRRDWTGHVDQKNHALSLASGAWVLSLDADEWLSEGAAGELQAALASPGAAAGFSFPRCSEWQGVPIRHGRWYPDRKLRCVRSGRGQWRGDDPHDLLHVEGPVQRLAGDILHRPYRSPWEHVSTVDRYATLAAQSLHARGVSARRRDLLLRPPLHIVDAYLLRRGFLDGPEGLMLAGIGAAYTALKWSRLRRLQA